MPCPSPPWSQGHSAGRANLPLRWVSETCQAASQVVEIATCISAHKNSGKYYLQAGQEYVSTGKGHRV